MKERYKFETNEKGELLMTDTETGKTVKVDDVVGDQSKGDATAIACAEAGKREDRRKNIDRIKEV